MLKMNKMWDKLKNLVDNNNKFVLSTHMNPDGDGIGSQLGFYYYLISQKKECKIINISNVSKIYKFLDPENIIETYSSLIHDEWIQNCDVAIIFDIGDYKRLGHIGNLIDKYDIFSVSIDHHPSNDSFFKLSILDIDAPATGYLIWKFFNYIKYDDFPLIVSNGLYASLITDTGSFRYNSTIPDCHIMAERLLKNGVKPYDIYSSIYEQKNINQIKLMGKLIENIKFFKDNEFVGLSVEKDILNL